MTDSPITVGSCRHDFVLVEDRQGSSRVSWCFRFFSAPFSTDIDLLLCRDEPRRSTHRGRSFPCLPDTTGNSTESHRLYADRRWCCRIGTEKLPPGIFSLVISSSRVGYVQSVLNILEYTGTKTPINIKMKSNGHNIDMVLLDHHRHEHAIQKYATKTNAPRRADHRVVCEWRISAQLISKVLSHHQCL